MSEKKTSDGSAQLTTGQAIVSPDGALSAGPRQPTKPAQPSASAKPGSTEAKGSK